ncbi:uncharacterized protein LOC125041657 [Penaeus chinensis]|uniref:uncharacterized protein LOC125041657 n=1 Tax=Penaeus chinensis TaxID=139456 RepID=UPI001FB7A0C2|nr:uncharacterized protein LOC125041657 [Penaeus chinensis]
MKGSAVVVAALVTLQIASCGALYPGSFYQMMLRLSKGHRNLVKNARTVSSPNQLWAILDPPAALGSLWNEPLNSNRIVRSAEFNDIEGRQLDGEPDVNTDAPAEADTAEADTAGAAEADTAEADTAGAAAADTAGAAEADTAEADTEAPEEATEAPMVCGGEIPTLLETGEVREDKLLINTTLETPGYDAEGYPGDIECIWNVNVESGCAMGFMTWQLDSSYIRSTRGCSEDFVEIGFDGYYTEKHCGTINGKTGARLWSNPLNTERSLNIRFLAGARDENVGGGKGIKIYINGFCSTYSDEYVAAAEATAETATEAVAEDATQRSDLDLDYSEDAVGQEVF